MHVSPPTHRHAQPFKIHSPECLTRSAQSVCVPPLALFMSTVGIRAALVHSRHRDNRHFSGKRAKARASARVSPREDNTCMCSSSTGPLITQRALERRSREMYAMRARARWTRGCVHNSLSLKRRLYTIVSRGSSWDLQFPARRQASSPVGGIHTFASFFGPRSLWHTAVSPFFSLRRELFLRSSER